MDAQVLRSMPPEIASGVIEVMLGVSEIERSQRNEHDNYNFASTDDYYNLVRPLMANAGIGMVTLEGPTELMTVVTTKNGYENKAAVQVAEHQFLLIHKSGVIWTHEKLKRTVRMRYMGAQGLTASQSYAEKGMLRSLFKISTGEADLDSEAQEKELSEAKTKSEVAERRKRKDAGQISVGRLYQLTDPDTGAVISGNADEQIAFVRGAVDRLPPKYKKKWFEENEAELRDMQQLHGSAWLEIKKMIETTAKPPAHQEGQANGSF